MNRNNPFASTNPFKPASSYLQQAFRSHPEPKHRSSLSQDTSDPNLDLDLESNPSTTMLESPDRDTRRSRLDLLSPNEATPRSIRLISLSRSPSRSRSAAQSEDEDEYDYSDAGLSRPLVAKDAGSKSGQGQRARIFQRGGVGQFLFGTGVGWQVYVALLVFWVGGCQFGLLLMNRFVLWTGTYKFPYPLTMTLLQLGISHVLILGFASLTRGLRPMFELLGLGAVVAPSHAYTRGNRASRYKGGQRHKPVWQNIRDWLIHGSGGIAGGGLFEYQTKTVKHVLPVAVIFTARMVLSNLSYAYAVLPMYMVARIAIIPLTILLTTLLLRTSHSVQTLSSALIATANLLMASLSPGRVTWESIVAGVFSSLFAALYPIILLRAYKSLVSDLVPQGDLLTDDDPSTTNLGTKEETRAYWRVLHYSSSLSILLLVPIVLLSGELKQINRNCYFLDVPWFWFLMLCGGLGTFAVFVSSLLLVKATSPLTANFVSVPRSAFQLVVLSKFRLSAHSWVGFSLCSASCVWYAVVRHREIWVRQRSRLEGRGG